jgi:uncharacterized protein YciI
MTDQPKRVVQYVVFHRPGPKWVEGVGFREQPGVADHVRHYAGLLEQGKLDRGGPFMTDDGGMMIAVAEMSGDELEAFAAADPAVQAGLLLYEIKPWFVAMMGD